MKVCTETNPRLLSSVLLSHSGPLPKSAQIAKSYLGALGVGVSPEKSAKKVTVTKASNKTTWDEETWTSSETKTKTNPDQKPANCESHRSLNSPEKQKRPVPAPVERKERGKSQICKRASTNTKKAKTLNLSEFKSIHQTYKQKLKLETCFCQKRITSKFAALASSPWSLLEFSKKMLLHSSFWLSISVHAWRL